MRKAFETERQRPGATGGSQRDLVAHIGKKHCVNIKKAVTERKNSAFLQRERTGLAGVKTGVGEYQLARLFGTGKFQPVVFKIFACFHRYVEAGMPAHGKRQITFFLVFHVITTFHGAVRQGIRHPELKIKRIHFFGFFVCGQQEGNCMVTDLFCGEYTAAGKPVQVHFIRLPFPGILALGQPPANGEKHRRTPCPIGWVTLPEIFGSGLFADDGADFRAFIRNGHFQLFVFQNIFHHFFLLSSIHLFFRGCFPADQNHAGTAKQ